MIRSNISVILFACIACSGTRSEDQRTVQGGRLGGDSIEVLDGDTAHVLPDDDWEVLSARHDARETFPEFVRRFRQPPKGQSDLAVKIRFAEANGQLADSAVEHIWLDPLAVDDSAIRGIVANTPIDLRRVKYGDTVRVLAEQVSDWYAVDRDTLVGGFSIRLFRSRLTKEARDSADRGRPYAIVGSRLDELLRLRGSRHQ